MPSCLEEYEPPPGTSGSNTPSTPSTPSTPPPPETPTNPSTLAKYQAWIKCMTLEDFNGSGMSASWANVPSQPGNAICAACHTNGGDGFIASNDEDYMFDTLKANYYYTLQYFVPAQTEPFEVVPNYAAMNGVSKGQDPHREHPRFSAEPGLGASRDFAARTQARYVAANGKCP